MKIVTFVDRKYLELGHNWLKYISNLGLLEQVLVICLDNETLNSFKDSGCSTILRPLELSSSADLWPHRSRIIGELLSAGHTIIHSDVDAIWLRDPLPYIMDQESDLIFSQGTFWPPEIHQTQGFVLCCGLFVAFSRPAVLNFFKDMPSLAAKTRSDQAAVNILVDSYQPTWEIQDRYQTSYQGKEITMSKSKIYGRTDSMVFTVLPHQLFPRVVDTEVLDTCYVAHPHTPKDPHLKRLMLEKLRLWFPGSLS